jgi:hypothetical protein
MAILTTLEFGLTVTGIVVPGLMVEGKIGVLTVTTWVFGLVEGWKGNGNGYVTYSVTSSSSVTSLAPVLSSNVT